MAPILIDGAFNDSVNVNAVLVGLCRRAGGVSCKCFRRGRTPRWLPPAREATCCRASRCCRATQGSGAEGRRRRSQGVEAGAGQGCKRVIRTRDFPRIRERRVEKSTAVNFIDANLCSDILCSENPSEEFNTAATPMRAFILSLHGV